MAHIKNQVPYSFAVTSKDVPVAAFADATDATEFGLALSSQEGKDRPQSISIKNLAGRPVYVSLPNVVKRDGRDVAWFETPALERLYRSLDMSA